MNQLLKIIHFLTKKNRMKILGMILIVGLFFSHHAYAAEGDGTLLNDTKARLDAGVSLLSWIRIFLAIIAGKLMTNDVVYGAFMHLDKYLRAIWNIMKNFANFGLAAMILYSIIKYVVDKKGDDPKKIVIKALVAGVLIQMSWFMVGALVDLSSIATSAVSAFPARFIGSNINITKIQEELKTSLAKPKKIVKIVDGKFTREPPEERSDGGSCGINNVDGLDAIMPKYDSVSGPLIFVGMSFLKTQNYMNEGTIKDTASGAGALIINLALKLLILLAFVGCLIGLVIANLVRILFLRLLIAVSPIAVLMGVFEKKMEGKGIAQYFNIQTFLDLIFKPVFFIGFLGLTLIFVSSMQQIMGGGKGIKDMNGVSVTIVTGSTASSTIAVGDVADFTLNSDVFEGIADDTKSVFVDLLLIVMTLLLLWQMLKWSITMGGGPVKDVMDKLTPFVESLAGNLPVVPVGGGMGVGNIWSASELATQKTLEGAGIKYGGQNTGSFFREEKKFKDLIHTTFFNEKPSRGEDDTKELESIIRKNDGTFWGAFIDKGKKTNEGISLGDSRQFALIEKWYARQKIHGRTEFQQIFGSTPSANENTFDEYMKHDDSNKTKLKKLHAALGGNEVLKNKITPASYEDLKTKKYHYNPEIGT